MPALTHYATGAMKQAPVLLTTAQAEKILEQLHETASYRGRVLHAVSILTNHVHMVFATPGDPEPDKILDNWKVYASRALNKLVGWKLPAPRPVWWARGGSKRILKTIARRTAATRYVRDQDNPLLLWLSPESTALLATYPDEAWTDALPDPQG
jgi:REP element-mobilizing transposase RayT